MDALLKNDEAGMRNVEGMTKPELLQGVSTNPESIRD
jgi:hypothetical protein